MMFTLLFESNPESDPKGQYVNVLDDSTLVKGCIASQNAGSSNWDIYYQVGGGGLNKRFADALGPLCTAINQALDGAYDVRFGSGARGNDKSAGRTDRLTSFYIPIPKPRPTGASVGARVAGMVYSVGPQLQGKVVDRDQFRQIYVDALRAVGAVNQGAETEARVDALRITMLSTGIYGGTNEPQEATRLARDVATLILDALVEAAAGPGADDLPATILVNTDVSGPSSKEVDAFTHAATARGITVGDSGFTLQSD